jgi:hypothetical protein
MQAAMASSLPNSEFSNSGIPPAKAAAIWLYLVASATILRYLIRFKYHRFIDLCIGLWFPQFIGMLFVRDPLHAPWWRAALPVLVLDTLFAIAVLVLAAKVSRRQYRATQVAFWLYAIDSLFIALGLAVLLLLVGLPIRELAWPSLDLIVHAGGLLILSRARRTSVSEKVPAQVTQSR